MVGKYPTVAMRSGKASEDRSSGVVYFDAVQCEERRITIKDGLVYVGQDFKTTTPSQSALRRQGNACRHQIRNIYTPCCR